MACSNVVGDDDDGGAAEGGVVDVACWECSDRSKRNAQGRKKKWAMFAGLAGESMI
jgi:hypothetical protein